MKSYRSTANLSVTKNYIPVPLKDAGAYYPELLLTKKCALIMIRSGFLKRASTSGMGIHIAK